MDVKFSSRTRVANCPRNRNGICTKPNLAVEPAEMRRLAAQGIPVSSQNVETFYDGELNPSWDSMPIEQTRGIDAADLWQLQRSTRYKVRQAIENDKRKYGD